MTVRLFSLLILLFSCSSVYAQILSDSTSNFYVAGSVGQAQHNIHNDLGTYGRSQTFPRFNFEVGYALNSRTFDKFYFTPSLGISFQQLSLRPLSESRNGYNDKLDLGYVHLNWLLHVGGKSFAIFGGPSLRIPFHSKFEVLSKTSDGSFKWISIENEIYDTHTRFALKTGVKIKFGVVQMGALFSTSKRSIFNSGKNYNPYNIDDLSFNTFEVMLYLPIKL